MLGVEPNLAAEWDVFIWWMPKFHQTQSAEALFVVLALLNVAPNLGPMERFG